jgi:hypothetical protein
MKNGKHIATIQAYHTDNKTQVDVWSNCQLIAQKNAYGCGYDRFAQALSGVMIDGVKMYDHSDTGYGKEKALLERALKNQPTDYDAHEEYWAKLAKKHGIQPANYRDGRWESAFYCSGLDRLKKMGYTVITGI